MLPEASNASGVQKACLAAWPNFFSGQILPSNADHHVDYFLKQTFKGDRSLAEIIHVVCATSQFNPCCVTCPTD